MHTHITYKFRIWVHVHVKKLLFVDYNYTANSALDRQSRLYQKKDILKEKILLLYPFN